MLLRAKDRLSDDFADAPPDGELTRARAGRVGRLRGRPGRSGSGCRCAASAQLYEFRLQHGFTDVADAAFERLLGDAVDARSRRSARSARRPAPPTAAPSKIPVDLLRQK